MFSKKGGRKTLGRRLFSLQTLLIFAFIAISLGTLYFIANVPANYTQIKLLSKQDMLARNEVYSAISMLDALNNKVKTGEMSLASAKKLGADLLRNMRYGATKDLYFFVDTTEGVNVVMLGDKTIEGKNRLSEMANGVYYIKELIKTSQQADGGYVNYMYPKPGETKAKEKRSYALEFKPFCWVVGSGYYIEDVAK